MALNFDSNVLSRVFFNGLFNNIYQGYKENTAPKKSTKIKKTNSRSVLNNKRKRPVDRKDVKGNVAASTNAMRNTNRPLISLTEVSEMLYEMYRANAAAQTAVCQLTDQQQSAIQYVQQNAPTFAETNVPSGITAVATNGTASNTSPKNLQSDEMVNRVSTAPFHPHIKTTDSNSKVPSIDNSQVSSMPTITAIPTSVLVPTTSSVAGGFDMKPIVHPASGLIIAPSTSVIRPVPVADAPSSSQAAAIAAALIRDGYHSFQQQIRAQEIIKFHASTMNNNANANDNSATQSFGSLMGQQRSPTCDMDTTPENNNGDGDNSFEDIHLMEASRTQLPQLLQMVQNSSPNVPPSAEYYSDDSQKYLNLAQAQALCNVTLQDNEADTVSNGNENNEVSTEREERPPMFDCNSCGKKYRWKSTLRRHQTCECGGKEPGHQCPYCSYKAKQRGNLGVHVRKHHPHLRQLTSKRRSKYSTKVEESPSVKLETTSSSANISDDSNSKLIIDCSK